MDDSNTETETKPERDNNVKQEPEKKRKGLALFIYDLKQSKLIPIKLLSLFVLSGYGVLLPYTAIHMKSLGISVEETGAIYGVSAIAGIFAPFGAGMVADKLGNFKVFLSASHGFASLCALLFLLIPTGRSSIDYPANLSLAFDCLNDSASGDSSTSIILNNLDSNSCDFISNGNPTQVVANVSVMCGVICNGKNRSLLDVNASQEVISLTTVTGREPIEFRHGDFFPIDSSLHLSCSTTSNDTNETVCYFLEKNATEIIRYVTLDPSSPTVRTGQISNHFQCGSQREEPPNSPLEHELQAYYATTESPVRISIPSHHYSFPINWTQEENENNVSLPESSACRPRCLVQIRRSDLCSNMSQELLFNPQLTFWAYMLLRVIFEILLGGSSAVFEGAALALVNELRGDYGSQRVFGFIGIAIFSPVSGALIDHFSIDENNPNFRPAYYLFASLFGIAALGMLTINLEFKPPAEKLMKDIKSLLMNIELDVLFLVTFVSGILLGCTGNYLFLFLEEIGATKSLMGLFIMVSCLSAVPLLLFSDAIYRKFGQKNVLVFCFAVYVIRLVGYSYSYEPRLCLLLESIEAVTGTLMITSLVTYAAQLGTTSTLASIQGLLAGIHYGLGGGTGSYVGSLIIGSYGQRATFRILGVIAFVTGFTYMLFNVFYLRRKNDNVNLKVAGNVEEV